MSGCGCVELDHGVSDMGGKKRKRHNKSRGGGCECSNVDGVERRLWDMWRGERRDRPVSATER